jgi:hypothetical protein
LLSTLAATSDALFVPGVDSPAQMYPLKKLRHLKLKFCPRNKLGYLEHNKKHPTCGAMPDGLKENDFPVPIATPSTKAEAGRDEDISTEKL